MTREQLDALERDIRFGLGAGQTKWARSKARMALAEILAQAREALELREAVDEALLALEVGSISEGSFVKAIRAARRGM